MKNTYKHTKAKHSLLNAIYRITPSSQKPYASITIKTTFFGMPILYTLKAPQKGIRALRKRLTQKDWKRKNFGTTFILNMSRYN